MQVGSSGAGVFWAVVRTQWSLEGVLIRHKQMQIRCHACPWRTSAGSAWCSGMSHVALSLQWAVSACSGQLRWWLLSSLC